KPLSLRGRRLLARDGAPRPLARARVGVRPLPPDRQVPPVAEPAVAAEIDQALDARRDVAAEVALDLVAGVDRAPKTRRLLVGQVVGLAPGIDLRLGAQLARPRLRPRDRSTGEISTVTLSPGAIRRYRMRSAPETWAST